MMTTSELFSKCEKIISEKSNILIFTHNNCDGDAVGSSFALALTLKAIGKNASVVLCDNPTKTLSHLLAEEIKTFYTANGELPNTEAYDLAIALDCANSRRMTTLCEDIYNKVPTKIKIDHHEPGENADFADVNVCDPRWSATCEGLWSFICMLLGNNGKRPDYEICIRLYTGILTDTGRFIYSCTTPDTMRTVAGIMEYTGTDLQWVAERHYSKKSVAEFRMRGIAYGKAEVYENGKLIFVELTDEDYKNANALPSDSSAIVSELMNFEDAEMSVVLRPMDLGKNKGGDANDNFRMSMRCSSKHNVQKVCAYFGGGGHICAAGADVVNISSKDAKAKILELAINALNEI